MKRLDSIDIVRGLVMIIMALDHVRDIMHIPSLTQSPTDLTKTTPLLFFTRFITHLCAPTFVFLAGASAYLLLKKNAGDSTSRIFLVKRGLYLVILEFALINFALFFDPGFHTFIFEVIAATGVGLMVLGFFSKASVKAIGLTGLAIIFLHNLAPLVPLPESSILKTVLMPLFGPGAFPISANKVFIMAYPPIPWLGIILVGFACGRWFELSPAKRKKTFLVTGFIAIFLFIVIRYINIYGDPLQWSYQKNNVYTFLSFINITKYPPSLLFCLATLGILFLLLAMTERAKGKVIEVISHYGKVPLFYFVIHFFVIHAILFLVLIFQGVKLSEMDFASGTFGRPKDVESGVGLGIIYIIWIGIVLILYKPCVWFGKYKAVHKKWWLKYI